MEENNQNPKMEKISKKEPSLEIKKKKAKIAVISLCAIVVIFIALQVYASKNGYGNVFFMIKECVTGQSVSGKEAKEKVSTKISEEDKKIDVGKEQLEPDNYAEEVEKDEIKQVIQDYLELMAHANCDSLLEELNDRKDINYNAQNDKISTGDATVTTNVKFKDYKNAMLKYVTEEEFERNWNESQYFKEDKNGYLVKTQGGGNIITYTVKSITLKGDFSREAYIANVNIHSEDGSKDRIENIEFHIKNNNGKYVISYCDLGNSTNTTNNSKEVKYTFTSADRNAVMGIPEILKVYELDDNELQFNYNAGFNFTTSTIDREIKGTARANAEQIYEYEENIDGHTYKLFFEFNANKDTVTVKEYNNGSLLSSINLFR